MNEVHRFGPFRYDSGQRVLFRDGEVVALAPKALDTLHVLLERRGQVVEKGELLRLVWPDCTVEEIGLARNISLLRKALGDSGEEYIQTVPKRGYRFAAEAREAQEPPRRRRAWLALIPAAAALAGVIYWQFYRPSRYVPRAGAAAGMAVVPFECLGGDCGDFSRGFTGTLVEEVSKLKSAQLISPSTVQRYRRLKIPTAVMSRLLGLDVVVEGDARKSGTRIRVSTRLTDVHSGKLIWAEGYDVDAADADSHSEAARRAAAEIGRRLGM